MQERCYPAERGSEQAACCSAWELPLKSALRKCCGRAARSPACPFQAQRPARCCWRAQAEGVVCGNISRGGDRFDVPYKCILVQTSCSYEGYFIFFSSFNFKNLKKCKTPTFPSLGITVSLFCLSSYSTAKGIFLITRSSSKMHR